MLSGVLITALLICLPKSGSFLSISRIKGMTSLTNAIAVS